MDTRPESRHIISPPVTSVLCTPPDQCTECVHNNRLPLARVGPVWSGSVWRIASRVPYNSSRASDTSTSTVTLDTAHLLLYILTHPVRDRAEMPGLKAQAKSATMVTAQAAAWWILGH